jgi:hypothetical protein
MFFVMALSWQVALANPTFLKCTGTQKVLIGENIYAPNNQSEVIEFELGVDIKVVGLFGFPTRIAPGCFEKESVTNQTEETKINCIVDDIRVSCTCSNDMAQSTLKISRRAGLFEIMSTYKKSNHTQSGKFSCIKSNAKVF